MRSVSLLSLGALAPLAALAAPTSLNGNIFKRENLCSLSEPPENCQPDPNVSVEETARRAYEFYRAFIVDGDPRKMFSLIDTVYKQNTPGYASGPNAIWPLFCGGRIVGTEANTGWCFDAATNMSYARYATIDRWRWVDGCVHEHWDQGEKMPPQDACFVLPAEGEEPVEETPVVPTEQESGEEEPIEEVPAEEEPVEEVPAEGEPVEEEPVEEEPVEEEPAEEEPAEEEPVEEEDDVCEEPVEEEPVEEEPVEEEPVEEEPVEEEPVEEEEPADEEP
ncbi:unnamed protein product [Parascedosporium putredinis]|uniref:Uncharacterized protein n=1 Tax=Parascedosporium putredinis TaxID=1442378 RepID=A0A9P1M9M3_9PEZI|nr:unnamed protein product [Parascedosporium putredinis]CAI7992334.1 unnamed protein product [Parascedosporium putredinis]